MQVVQLAFNAPVSKMYISTPEPLLGLEYSPSSGRSSWSIRSKCQTDVGDAKDTT